MLTFPLWVIKLPQPSARGIRYFTDGAGYVYVFTARDGALNVLMQRITAGMITHCLRRDEMVLLVADMHAMDIPGICLDPSPDDR
jgi:hypothetical protein